MKKLKLVDNISGLQAVQLLRFTTFFIISVVFTKSHLTRAEIGQWEMFLFISSLLSFFWVSGIIQSLLTLYNRNRTFRSLGDVNARKSPEIYNSFLLLVFFSLLIFALGMPVNYVFPTSGMIRAVPYSNLLFWYILLSNPVAIIEYIYLLNNRSHRILQYGIYTYVAQIFLVLVPVIMGKDLLWAVYGLFIITFARWIWLITLLRRYTIMEFSWDYIREQLRIGAPLIITFLISGSSQYVDGLIIRAKYSDPGVFAMYRYGAKEFPLTLLLANGLSNALLPHFSTREGMKDALATLKKRSRKLINILFPATMVTMFFARWLYPRMFTPEYIRSADVFLIYLLLVIPRLIFPQTIVIGRKKTHITLIAAIIEIAINVPLSLLLIKPYGVAGVAIATFFVYSLEKLFLMGYVWAKMKIKPTQYIPLARYLIFSVLTAMLFVMIDHRWIDFH
ncbi:MAG TPA: polysaccharide biosynthesis C-terminal domain-containing protein [Bacteroidales bacterium]|nr:polysaccharide biosynthesis C-terminal domain-containing protein [Bacteroidales bacterium]